MSREHKNPSNPLVESPLQGWKEIAAYVGRDQRTTRRWELEEGLPIRRHRTDRRSSVYAYPSEIDAWRASRPARAGDGSTDTALDGQPRWPRQTWIPVLVSSVVIALAILVIRFGPVLNPPSPVAEASDDALQTELVWDGAAGVSPQGSVSQDGRFVTYVDWSDGGNLAIRDLATNESRHLTHTADNGLHFAANSRISPDGKLVAYTWFRSGPDGETGELRLLPLQGDEAEPRTLWSPPDGYWASVEDWFPGGDRLAGVVTTSDETHQIVAISLDDAQVRQIRSIPWGEYPQLRVSPDGGHLAYSRSASREAPEKDIFLIAVDGQSEVPIVQHAANDELVAWSSDGKQLLFNSDRSGQPGLWAQRVEDGKPHGDALLIMPNLNVGWGMGVTREGTLHYSVRVSRRRLKIAEVDMDSGKVIRQPVDVTERFVAGNSRGVFSPDGEKLAYVSSSQGDWSKAAIVIRTLATGEEKELPHQLQRVRTVTWQADNERLHVDGRDGNDRQGFFEVDAASGETRLLAEAIPGMMLPVWTRDAKQILYRDYHNWRNNQGMPRPVYAYSLADGSVKATPGNFGQQRLSHSPDGERIATIDQAASRLLVRAVEGGDIRVLWSPSDGGRLGRWAVWTPDGKALLVLRQDATEGGKDLWRLWVVPVDGSSPIATELRHELANFGAHPLDVHPDGRQIVHAAGGYFYQFWALHNLGLEQTNSALE